jgi:hypothetical protein
MCLLAFHPERTFTSGAANGSCEPIVPNAARGLNGCNTLFFSQNLIEVYLEFVPQLRGLVHPIL